MIIIGLTGSIAMGKSEVSQIFQHQGIAVFDSDSEVHALYDSAEGVALLKPLVPGAIVEGKIHRPTLTALVLKDQTLLNQVEQLVHAEVAKHRDIFRSKAEQTGQSIIVYDMPLLFEKASENIVDITIVVSAPQELQKHRALSRPGMTSEKLDMILKRQLQDVEKRHRADYIIENDGTLADLRQKTLAVLNRIKQEHGL